MKNPSKTSKKLIYFAKHRLKFVLKLVPCGQKSVKFEQIKHIFHFNFHLISRQSRLLYRWGNNNFCCLSCCEVVVVV